MIQKEIDDARITTPSDTSVGRVETPGFSDGTINSSKRSRPSLLASVGKIFADLRGDQARKGILHL